MSALGEAEQLAKILVEHLPEIREGLELLAEVRRRAGRPAQSGDLADSIAKLRSLDRSRG